MAWICTIATRALLLARPVFLRRKPSFGSLSTR